jgi:hypothetical protein
MNETFTGTTTRKRHISGDISASMHVNSKPFSNEIEKSDQRPEEEEKESIGI